MSCGWVLSAWIDAIAFDRLLKGVIHNHSLFVKGPNHVWSDTPDALLTDLSRSGWFPGESLSFSMVLLNFFVSGRPASHPRLIACFLYWRRFSSSLFLKFVFFLDRVFWFYCLPFFLLWFRWYKLYIFLDYMCFFVKVNWRICTFIGSLVVQIIARLLFMWWLLNLFLIGFVICYVFFSL